MGAHRGVPVTLHAGAGRWAWVEIDLGAIRHNVARLRQLAAPAGLWAVVKADGYGHGAVAVATAALAAGADGLCVALASEGAVLRDAGIDAPILVLSEQPSSLAAAIVRYDLTPTVATFAGVEALGAAARAAGRAVDVHADGRAIDARAVAAAVAGATGSSLGVHLKVDTGMHRTGAAPADVPALVDLIDRTDGVHLAGVFTHMAVADEPDRPETAEQLQRFDAVLATLGRRGIARWALRAGTAGNASSDDRRSDDGSTEGGSNGDGSSGVSARVGGAGVGSDDGTAERIVIHAANSAATLTHPAARHSFVRAGIALYGIAPGPAVADAELRPALALKARVSLVKRLAAGERLSYGLRHELPAETTIATVPIGYADGVRRGLSGTGMPVLIGGRRCPIVGTVTMDQLLVDVGDAPVAVGDEVVLIGRQGDEQVRAEDWADALGTIGYEIVCGIGSRVPRRVLA